MIMMGASLLIAMVVAPRFRDYAVVWVLHSIAVIVAMNLGPNGAEKPSRTTNFVVAMVVSLAFAYNSEAKRRENLLLAWRLHRSSAAVANSGARNQMLRCLVFGVCFAFALSSKGRANLRSARSRRGACGGYRGGGGASRIPARSFLHLS